MFGDVAIAVHPDDERYARYIGRRVLHPIRGTTIPIVADFAVKREFGTGMREMYPARRTIFFSSLSFFFSGAVKITPAHDRLDHEIAKRHNLPLVNAIDENGNMTKACNELEVNVNFLPISRLTLYDTYVVCNNLSTLFLYKIWIRGFRALIRSFSGSTEIRCQGKADERVDGPRDFTRCGQGSRYDFTALLAFARRRRVFTERTMVREMQRDGQQGHRRFERWLVEYYTQCTRASLARLARQCQVIELIKLCNLTR